MDNRLTRHRARRSRMTGFFADTDHAPLIASQQDVAADVAGFNSADTAWKAKTIRDMHRGHKAALTAQNIDNAVLADMDAKINAAAVKTKPGETAADQEAKREWLQAGDDALELQLEKIVQTLHAEYRYTEPRF